MNVCVAIQERARIWKIQILAAYALGGFSILGLLGAAETHSSAEAYDSTVGLGLAIAWVIVARLIIPRRCSRSIHEKTVRPSLAGPGGC